ncbi:MAG: class I SAM-dependent methyltransferase [Verrucomicrobiales bacterium]
MDGGSERREADASMDLAEYAKMAAVEDSMWWYRALHRNMLSMLRRFGSEAGAEILDAGCGTGGLLKFLRREQPGHHYQGLELHGAACPLAHERAGVAVTHGSVNELPFAGASLDVILSTNVLEQRGVEPGKAAAEAWRCLRPGGLYLVSESALSWLRSYHDRRVGVERRFTRRELGEILAGAGFDIAYASYWNSVLFPLVVLRRKVFSSEQSESDVGEYSRPVEMVFDGAIALERVWQNAGGTFPFGVSVMMAAIKPEGGRL